MNHLYTLLLAASMLPTFASARDTEPTRALTMCPGGLALGIFACQYEMLLQDTHGLVLRADYEAIPETYTDADIDSDGYAFILNYRYHFRQQMASPYLGAYLRYRSYSGEGRLAATGEAFDFTLPETTLGLNVGRRWVWNNGFTINFMLGYGISWQDRQPSSSGSGIERALDDWEDSYDFADPFLGEFSIGYAF